MVKWIRVALTTTLVSMFFAVPASAQSPGGAGSTGVALGAQLQEAQNQPRELERLYKIGKKVAAVCANCHGEGGSSVKPDIPNLAGQNPAYLLEQIRQFSTGERRNEFMEGLIKVLKPDEKVGMVVFYSGQEVQHRPADNPALVSKGQSVYAKTCQSCHGSGGRGNEKMARIAGQQAPYLTLTIKRYRDGSSVRKDPLMATSTQRLSDADIAAVVAYVATLK